MHTFNATFDVEIKWVGGSDIADPNHVLAWTCDDANGLLGGYASFDFDVCPTHADPDECDHTCTASPSTYRATIMSATPEAS